MNGDGGVRRLQQGRTAVDFLSCKHRPRRNVHGSLLTYCSSGGCNAGTRAARMRGKRGTHWKLKSM